MAIKFGITAAAVLGLAGTVVAQDARRSIAGRGKLTV